MRRLRTYTICWYAGWVHGVKKAFDKERYLLREGRSGG